MEALNRDSCINVAKLAKKDTNFVFISAADTIAPMFKKYSDMKGEAEAYLLKDENIKPVILRPGLVWHQNQRQWSFPLKVVTDLGYLVNRDIVSKVAPGSLSNVLP